MYLSIYLSIYDWQSGYLSTCVQVIVLRWLTADPAIWPPLEFTICMPTHTYSPSLHPLETFHKDNETFI